MNILIIMAICKIHKTLSLDISAIEKLEDFKRFKKNNVSALIRAAKNFIK